MADDETMVRGRAKLVWRHDFRGKTEIVSKLLSLYISYYKHFTLIINKKFKIDYEIIFLLTINIYNCGFTQIDV